MSDDRARSDWIARNTPRIAAALALCCILAVAAIALYDQLLGTERWCFRWLDERGAERTICSDNERACDFDRQQRCIRHPEGAASDCRPRGDEASLPAACRR